MGHIVDLQSVSRFFFAADLPFTAEGESTENCCAHFRMTREQERIVRAHFKIHPDLPIQFATSEIARQGNGWYLAFSLSEKPDQALRAILNIKAALWAAANPERVKQENLARQSREITLQAIAKAKPVRRIIVKWVQDRAGRLVAKSCDRELQAQLNKANVNLDAYRVEKIRNEMCSMDLDLAVSHLKQHFACV